MIALWLLGIGSGLLLVGALEAKRRQVKRETDTMYPDLLRGIVKHHVIARAPGLRKLSRLDRFKRRLKVRG